MNMIDRTILCFDLHVVTTKSLYVPAKQTYMDRPDIIHHSLQGSIDVAGVDVLHKDYYDQVDRMHEKEWIEWLHEMAQVNTTLRVEAQGQLSQECSQFTTEADTIAQDSDS